MMYNEYNRRLERWIINHQTGRRNLTKSQLVKAYASVEEQLKREAKERQVTAGKEFGKGGSKVTSNLTEAISKAPETAEVVAKKIGVSKNTYKGMKQIVSEGTPEQIERMNKGGKGNGVSAIAKKAKENQIRKSVSQKSVEQKPIDTQKELARIAGMSHDTIHRVEVRIGELLKQKKLSVPKSFSILHRIVHIPETDANEKIPTKITVHPDTVRRFSLRKLDS